MTSRNLSRSLARSKPCSIFLASSSSGKEFSPLRIRRQEEDGQSGGFQSSDLCRLVFGVERLVKCEFQASPLRSPMHAA